MKSLLISRVCFAFFVSLTTTLLVEETRGHGRQPIFRLLGSKEPKSVSDISILWSIRIGKRTDLKEMNSVGKEVKTASTATRIGLAMEADRHVVLHRAHRLRTIGPSRASRTTPLRRVSDETGSDWPTGRSSTTLTDLMTTQGYAQS